MDASSLNSQILYNWLGNSSPIEIKQEDKTLKVASHEDVFRAMNEAESALGQKILQDNSDKIRNLSNITDQDLSQLNTGTATAAQCAAEINKIYNILTNLIQT